MLTDLWTCFEIALNVLMYIIVLKQYILLYLHSTSYCTYTVHLISNYTTLMQQSTSFLQRQRPWYLYVKDKQIYWLYSSRREKLHLCRWNISLCVTSEGNIYAIPFRSSRALGFHEYVIIEMSFVLLPTRPLSNLLLLEYFSL